MEPILILIIAIAIIALGIGLGLGLNLITIIAVILFSLGMLYQFGTNAMIEQDQTRRRIAYETRDDATIKTLDDDQELEQKRAASNRTMMDEESNSNSSNNNNNDDELNVDPENGKVDESRTCSNTDEESNTSETLPSVIIVDIDTNSSTSVDDEDGEIDIETGELEASPHDNEAQ